MDLIVELGDGRVIAVGHNSPVLTLTQNIEAQDAAALHKIHGARRPLNYLVAAMLAGAFIGLADVFMFTAAGPLRAADSPWAPLTGGAVFGIGLILVVFAGGELATSAMMILPMATIRQKVDVARAIWTFILMLVGNLAGSVVVALLVLGSRIMTPDTPVGQMLAAVSQGKVDHSASELFFRAVLCNILVCLAMWCVTRTSNDVAKILLMAWCMAAFVGSGFEHVVANMTTLSLALAHQVDGVTLAGAARNLGLVLAGNMVGGGVFVGGAYLMAHRTEQG